MCNDINDNHLPGAEGTNMIRDGWKQKIRNNFARWLSQVSDMEPEDNLPGHETPPDLYSFYSEICALRVESKKSSIRSQENFQRFGTILEEFQSAIDIINDGRQKSNETDLYSAREGIYKILIDIFIRFERIHTKLEKRPKPPLLIIGKQWEKERQSLREAFSLVYKHLDGLIKNEGITRIETRGAMFDPHTMVAVSTEQTNRYDPNTIIEDISPGYLYKNRLLKTAEVKVAVQKEN